MTRFESVRWLDLATRALRRALVVPVDAAESAGLQRMGGRVAVVQPELPLWGGIPGGAPLRSVSG